MGSNSSASKQEAVVCSFDLKDASSIFQLTLKADVFRWKAIRDVLKNMFQSSYLRPFLTFLVQNWLLKPVNRL